MQRYFVDQLSATKQVEITGDDFFHLTKVMRSQVGEHFLVVIAGQTARVEIVEITHEKVIANVQEWLSDQSELPVEVTLVCGLPKGDKFDWIVQKATELGVHQLVPFQAERSVVKWDEKKANKKIERWQKIAKEAAEQAHRTIIPTVLPAANHKQVITSSKNYDYILVAYEENAQSEFSQFSSAIGKLQPGNKLMMIFGPEGGFTSAEIKLFTEQGFQTCGLGKRILRAETAPLFVMSALIYQLELKVL